MTYREPARDAERSVAAREKLEQLVRRGARARDAARREAEAEKQIAQDLDRRKRERRAAREALMCRWRRLCSMSAIGFLLEWRLAGLTIVVLLFPFLALGILLEHAGTTVDREFWDSVLLAAYAGIVVVTYVSTFVHVRRRARAERAWLARLPFDAEQIWILLGREPSRRRELSLLFPGGAPTQQVVEDLLAGAGLTADKVWVGQSEVGVTMLDRSEVSNNWLRKWLHTFVDRVALPLHDVYPIRRLVTSSEAPDS